MQTALMEKRAQKFKEFNFKKKWLDDKSGYWYEKNFKIDDMLEGKLYFGERFMSLKINMKGQPRHTIENYAKSEKTFMKWCEKFVNLPK
jgi:hypothetical protein